MISAPHNVSQFREGKQKCAEPYTGVLAEMLHEELDCPIIYKTKNCNDDANYDSKCEYKSALESFVNDNAIAAVIDLHQMSPARSILIDIGTGNGKNLITDEMLSIIKNAFYNEHIEGITVGKPFDARYSYTVSSYIARECKIPCVQLEINSKLLRKKYDDYSFENVYNALKKCCVELSKAL